MCLGDKIVPPCVGRANGNISRPGDGGDAAIASAGILDEFLAADIVVIGAPMYNFTLPSQLKAWIDRILVRVAPSVTVPKARKGSPAASA
jgi:FMN-dependent NADH-azoreductase